MILSQTQSMIQRTARSFSGAEIAPHAALWDQEENFPGDAIIRMGDLGLLGMVAPEKWGGSGADAISLAVAIEEIAAGDATCAIMLSAYNSLFVGSLLNFGSDDLKAKYLPGMVTGETLCCFALSEPQAGSDASNIQTRARLAGDSYVINGGKQFITAGAVADLAVLFAVTDPEAGPSGISCFLVPTNSPGFVVAKVEKKLGIRSSKTAQLIFENLEVPSDHMIGAPGQGYRIALTVLGSSRIGVAAQAVGVARAAYETALGYAKEREAFGKPIIAHQAVGFRLADMATKIEAARQLVYHAAALKDASLPFAKAASMAKIVSSEMAERVCSDAIQTLGGYGYLADFPVERYYRDVRVCQIYEGTNDIHRLIIRDLIAGDVVEKASN